MSDPNLDEIFKKASEIAKNVPEKLQEIAFNRALDELLKKDSGKIKGKPSTKEKRKEIENDPQIQDINFLLKELDRTKYPKVYDASDVLSRSLWILFIAQNEFELDGLGPTDISKILTEKFRIKSSRQAVTYALDAAGNKVDRVSLSGKKPYYRIMQPGEDFIHSNEPNTPTTKKPKSKSSNSRKTKPKDSKKNADNGLKQKNKNNTKVGSKKIMTDLIREGFFDNPKKIKEIQEYILHKQGYKFDVTHLSPNLTRLLREGKLDREKSSDGQYEYKRK